MAKNNGQTGLFEQPVADKPVTYEYEVFLSISKNIEEDAVMLKAQTEAIVGPDRQKYFRPHISFLSFKQKAEKDLVLSTLQAALVNTSPIDVEINGFGIFHKGPYGQTLFLNVVESEELKNLYALIQSTFRCGKMKGLHLTIVRTVYLDDPETVLGQLNALNYTGTFRCTQLTLLRRPKDTKEKYEEVGILNLGN
ncbi:2'-5' RNA ligase family protein [Dyadobacter subterraneus]|uniref:2'-5' RNA ligase family protein n=1 Tax=Dyadobacter subterraneus TaxID=2773304 RepID=A0ABR9W5Y8_9BACT|nr:2'-5' RNA ligase family protein [Dyadobacter subterraneus]MBE9460865.1 2'-5' RNA ligase family protein [Dyadobacter subterraneus]